MFDVSVIIPTHNRLLDLKKAINSVFDQENVLVECIVVDDCSTDGTVEYIRNHYKSHALKVIQKSSRSGPQSCRNLGMKVARGTFITFLDSDDILEADTLHMRVQLCQENKLDSLFSSYKVTFLGQNWQLTKVVFNSKRMCPSDYWEALKNFKIAPMITIMYRRTAFLDLQLDEKLASGHDDDLSLLFIKRGRFKFDDIVAATIFQHPGERVANPRNLAIGDAQLVLKYAKDLVEFHGVGYLKHIQGRVSAGLVVNLQFSALKNFASKSLLYNTTSRLCLITCYYLPYTLFRLIRMKLIMFLVGKLI